MTLPRLHVVGLPHTLVTRDFGACAFTQKVLKFANMMTAAGKREIVLYGAGTTTDARGVEFVSLSTDEERAAACATVPHYTDISWDMSRPFWMAFNQNAVAEISKRVGPRDIICIIGGSAQQMIGHAFPDHLVVEFGVGYHGTFAKHRVFESYAHMHAVYAAQAGSSDIDGVWFDAVIPNYFEVADFPFSEAKDDYYLFMGRMTERKGLDIAAEACRAINKRLIAIGPGVPPPGVEYGGTADHDRRGLLLSRAKAVFCPTKYIEPFGGVAVEAMMCGTPVITTDWGAFTETVVQGVTGFRCRSLAEFVDAAVRVKTLSPELIRLHAVDNYSTEVIAPRYEAYFTRLSTLWGGGWYDRSGM